MCDFQDCLITKYNVMDRDKETFYQLFPYLQSLHLESPQSPQLNPF